MKKWFFNVLNFFCFGKLSKCPFKIDESPFQLLTPTDDAEDIGPYERAMDFALSKAHKVVKNIAVTGLYGAGKSSFLRTYFGDRKDVLWVSLALFLEQEGGRAPKKMSEEFERRLELSILQQLFHVRKESTLWSWEVLVVVMLIGCGLLGVLQPDVLVRYVSDDVHQAVISCRRPIFWISLANVVVPLLLLFRRLIIWLKSLGVTRVDVKGAGVGSLGIELPKDMKCSILNRNVRTIIGYFADSDIRTVVFEDIDRFDNVRIFTKLRELNLLLNNSKQISNRQKPIRFVYALREDLFVDEKEKVKFFEFVIPIIPRVNASNSRIELMASLKKCGEGEISSALAKMVKDISPWISDMRLLKNICNEYYTYREQILDCTSEEELLGLIVFKNYFPRDFALMHDNAGKMRVLMEIVEQVKLELVQKVDLEISEAFDEIKKIKNEKGRSVKELQEFYYVALMRHFDDGAPYLYYKDSRIHATEIIHQDDWFDELRNNRLWHNEYGRKVLDWKEIEHEADPNCSYDEHLKCIEGKVNGRIDVLNKRIQDLHAERDVVKRKTIVELMRESALREGRIKDALFKKSTGRRDVDLFVALVRNGYLNEQYRYNISIFHAVDGVTSIKDYYLEMAITKGEGVAWDAIAEKPKEIVANLDLHCFSTPAILNFSICTEVLAAPESDKAKEFLRLITCRVRRNYDFIGAYLKTLKTKDEEDEFFGCVMAANENYISELVEMSLEGEGWPREFVEKQVGLFIAWALRQGRMIAITGFVKTFMEETERMPDLLKENGICAAGEMTAFVKMFGLRFKQLNCKAAKAMGLLDVVIAERAYAIESDIIKGVLAGDGVDVAGFETKNYSVISKHKPVVACVDAEFKHYLDAVYLKCEAQQEDELERVLTVINRENLSVEDKQKFIHHQWRKSRVDDVKKIKSDEMVRFCIDEDWLVSSWSNAGEVWNRFKDDRGPFRAYVNRESCFKELSKENSSPFPWDKNVGWIKSLVEDEGLSDEAIGGLLSGMPAGTLTTYSGENATPTRIEILVRSGRIKFANDLYRALKSHGNDSHIMLATMCAKEFCGAYVDGLANKEDAKKILTSNQLNRKYVVRVINTLKDLIVGSGDLIDEVVGFINKGNYTEFDEGVLDAALDSTKPVSLQCRIIQHLGGDADEIRRQLGRLDEPYKKLAGLGCRQQISRWDGVEGFLTFLKEKGVVSTTGEGDGGKIQVNTTRS